MPRVRASVEPLHPLRSICFIPIPFDPKPVFGKVRAPVEVTLNGYTYRSTIAAMGGTVCIPLRKSHRERRIAAAIRRLAARPEKPAPAKRARR